MLSVNFWLSKTGVSPAGDEWNRLHPGGAGSAGCRTNQLVKDYEPADAWLDPPYTHRSACRIPKPGAVLRQEAADMLIVRRTEQESLLRSTLLAKVLEPRAHRLVEAGDARALACDCAGRVTSSPRSRRWRASRQGWYDRAGPQALARAARRLV